MKAVSRGPNGVTYRPSNTVTAVHFLDGGNILVIDGERELVNVSPHPLWVRALRQHRKSFLHTPPQQDLSFSNPILLGHGAEWRVASIAFSLHLRGLGAVLSLDRATRREWHQAAVSNRLDLIFSQEFYQSGLSCYPSRRSDHLVGIWQREAGGLDWLFLSPLNWEHEQLEYLATEIFAKIDQ